MCTSDTSKQASRQTNAVHTSLHQMYQTQWDQEATWLGGEESPSPSWVSGTEGEHQGQASWVCLQERVREIPKKVSAFSHL